jgi:16S rRNA (cytidine1402-2'-O)-methyltransferase
MPSGSIFLIPTPLALDAESQTVTPFLKQKISEISYFWVENIRSARRFISSLKLGIDISSLHFEVLDKNTDTQTLKTYFEPLLAGHDVGLMSEAGCPGIADPGSIAVEQAHLLGIKVMPLVGASSIILALMASGMNGQSFVFHGYLPIDSAARVKSIRSLEKESITKSQTQIFIETPYRNPSLLNDILKACQPNTRLCIAANLTAADEYIRTLTIQDWKKNLPDINKKPAIFLLQA